MHTRKEREATYSPHQFRTVQNTALQVDVYPEDEQLTDVFHDVSTAHFYFAGRRYVGGDGLCVFDRVVD